MFAPASTTSLTRDAISSGLSGNTSTPLTVFGSPALAWTSIGVLPAAVAHLLHDLDHVLDSVPAVGADDMRARLDAPRPPWLAKDPSSSE